MFALEWGYLTVLVLGKCSRRNAAQWLPCGITSNMGSMQTGLVPQVLLGAWWTRWSIRHGVFPRGWQSNEHKGALSINVIRYAHWRQSNDECLHHKLKHICLPDNTISPQLLLLKGFDLRLCFHCKPSRFCKALQVLSQDWNLTSANK